jgi:hypothetical protein
MEQYKLMELGGNNKAKNYFQKNGIATKKIPQKYISSSAKLYKKELQHLVEQEFFFFFLNFLKTWKCKKR